MPLPFKYLVGVLAVVSLACGPESEKPALRDLVPSEASSGVSTSEDALVVANSYYRTGSSPQIASGTVVYWADIGLPTSPAVPAGATITSVQYSWALTAPSSLSVGVCQNTDCINVSGAPSSTISYFNGKAATTGFRFRFQLPASAGAGTIVYAGVNNLMVQVWYQSITTGAPLSTATMPATAILPTSFVLNGVTNPNNLATTTAFRINDAPVSTDGGGCGPGFGIEFAAATLSASVGTLTQFSLGITGATASTTYYYCASASNSMGTQWGSVVSFTTPPPDVTPPAVSATETGTTGSITFGATATDASGVARVEFYVDGVLKGSDTTAPYSLAFDSRGLANGAHTLVAKAYDLFNQVGTSAGVAFSTSNDLTPPTVTATEVGTTGTITFSATAADVSGVSKVEFYVDGVLRGTDTTAPYSMTYNSRLLANGAHSLTAKAYDTFATFTQVGTSAAVSFTTANDFAGPTVTAAVAGTAGTITLSASAADPSGVLKVEFYIDGVLRGTDTAAPYSMTYNSRLLGNGTHALTAKAFDTLNQATTSAAASFTTANDFAGPVVSVAETGTTGTITFSATATDATGVAKVEYFVDGVLRGSSTVAPYTVSFNSRLLSNASHGMYGKATDTWGQVAYSTAISFATSNDFAGPTVSVSVSGTSGIITISAAATDPSGISQVKFYVDGVVKATVTQSPYALLYDSRMLANGNHSFAAAAYDTFNQGTTSTTVVAATNNDFAAPVIGTATVTGTSGIITLAATATDATAVSKVEFYIDGVLRNTLTAAPYTTPFDSRTLINGNHSMTVKAYDPYSQASTKAVTFTVAN